MVILAAVAGFPKLNAKDVVVTVVVEVGALTNLVKVGKFSLFVVCAAFKPKTGDAFDTLQQKN